MEDPRRVEHDVRDLPATQRPATGDAAPRREAWLAAPVVAILAVVCCAGPLLFAALVATGAGAWLAAHGYTLGAVALIVLALVLAWGMRTRMSRG